MGTILRSDNDSASAPSNENLARNAALTGQPPKSPGLKSKESFGKRYAKYVGIVKDAPADLAANHDAYLYGAPKVES